jgi:hypothetical protein
MIRLVLIVAVAGLPILQEQEKEAAPIDPALVEKFRALSPEQKERLRRRVEALREIAPGERRRLQENLDRFRSMPPERQKAVRERLAKMSPEELRRANEIAHGFFRRMHARYGPVRFPRGAFFRWAAGRKAAEFETLKDLDDGSRADALLKLAHEYRGVLQGQVRQHARRHGCYTEKQAQDLEDLAFGDFWGEAEKLQKSCPNAPKRPPPPPARKP